MTGKYHQACRTPKLLMYCNENFARHITGLTSYSGAYLRHTSSGVSGFLLTDAVVTVITVSLLSYKDSLNWRKVTDSTRNKRFIRVAVRQQFCNISCKCSTGQIFSFMPCIVTASVVQWSEFLATDTEVPGSIPGATRFSEQQWVWNGVHSAS